MSATIDERVVEMKFDNKDFESNVKESLSTLDKLEDALKFTKSKESLQTLDKAVKNVSLDAISNSIQAIEQRFSTMGIVGMVTIQRLTNAAIDMGKKIITAIPNQIATGGWKRAMNVEQAKFTLKGLGIAWEEVSEDINHAVQDTAYGADEASKAASSLAASGVNFRNATKDAAGNIEVYSDMGRALRAISGVAAMTNSSYSDIADIFTKVAGNGRIMTNELNQLAGRGLNVAATLGQQLGKSEAEIRAMVKKGQIDFQTFADAMDSAFGEHATAANETFDGSMANMKASLSRIGQDFAQTIQQQTPQVFNSVKKFFNAVRKITKPFADYIFTPAFTKTATIISRIIDNFTKKLSAVRDGPIVKRLANFRAEYLTPAEQLLVGISKIFSGLSTILSNLYYIFKSIGKAFKDTFGNSGGLKAFMQFGIEFNAFANRILLTNESAAVFGKVFSGIFAIFRLGLNVVTGVLRAFSPLLKVVASLAGAFLKITGAISSFVAEVINAISGSDELTSVFDALYKVINFLSDILVFVVDNISELVEQLIKLAHSTVVTFLTKAINAFKEFARRVDLVNNLIRVFILLVGVPVVAVGALAYGIYALANAFLKLEPVAKILDSLKRKLNDILPFIMWGISNIKKGMENLINYIRNFSLRDFINGVKNAFDSLVKSLENFIIKIAGGEEKLNKMKETFRGFIEGIKGFKDALFGGDAMNEFTGSLDKAGEATYSLKDGISSFIETIKNFVSNIDISKIIVLGYAVAMLSLVLSMNKAILGFASATNAAKKMFNTINMFYTFKKRGPSNIMAIAKAIIILVASLAILAAMPRENVESSVKVIGNLLVAFGLFFGVITGLSEIMKDRGLMFQVRSIAMMIVALSLAFVSLAASMKILEGVTVSWNLIGVLLIALGAVRLLVGIAKTAGGKSSLGTVKNLLTFISVAVLLLSVAKTLEKLASIDWSGITANLESVAIVMALLGVLAVLASHIRITSAPGLLIFVYMLNYMMEPLQKLLDYAPKFRSLLEALSGYEKILGVLAGIAIAITFVGGLLGKGIKAFGMGVLAMSAAFVVLAKGIISLAKIKISDIDKAMDVIQKVFGVFTVMIAFFALGKGGKYAFRIGLAITALTASLYLLSGVIGILGSMDAGKLHKGTKVVEGVLAMFALIMGAASLGDGKKGVGTIIALVVGLATVLSLLVVISFIPYESLLPATAAITLLMLGLSRVIRALSNPVILNDGQKANRGTGTLLILMGGLAILMLLLSKLCDYVSGDFGTLVGFGASMALILAGLGMALRMIINITNKNKVNRDTIFERVTQFVELSLAVIPLGAALTLANAFPWSSYIAPAASIVAVMIALGGLFTWLSKMKGRQGVDVKKRVEAFGMLSLSLIPIGVALAAVASLDLANVLAATGAIALILAELGIILNILSSKDNKFSKAKAWAFVMASGVLLTIMASLAILAQFNWAKILVATVAMAVVMASFRKTIAVISDKDSKFDMGKAAGLALASLSLLAIAGSLAILAQFEWDKILVGCIALSAVLLALSHAINVMDNVKFDSLGNWAGIGAALALLIIVVGAIAVLNKIDGLRDGSLTESLYAVATIMVALAVVIAVAGKVGGVNAVTGAIGFVIGAAIFVAGLIALLWLIGAAFEGIDGLETTVKKGCQVLSDIGSLLGKAIGEFIGGIGEGITDHLPAMGDNITKFMESIEPMTEVLKKFDSEAADGGGRLALFLAEFSAGGIVAAIADFLGGSSIENVSQGLRKFARATGFMLEKLQDTDTSRLNVITMLVDTIGKSIETLAGGFTNLKSEEMYNTICDFGEAIGDFADEVSGLKGTEADGAYGVVYKIGQMLKSLPNSGGALGKLVGNNDIGMFVKKTSDDEYELVAFAKAVCAFAETAAGCGNAVGNCITVATELFSIDLPDEGGVIADWLGDNKIAYFIRKGSTGDYELAEFAHAICRFADVASNCGNAVDNAIEVASKVFNLDLPDEGGVLADFLGDNKMDVIGPQLPTLAEGIVGFAEECASIEGTGIKGVENALAIITMLDDEGFFLSYKNVLKDFFDGFGKIEFIQESLKYIKKVMKGLKYLTDTFSEFTGASLSGTENAIAIINKLDNENFFFYLGKLIKDMLELSEVKASEVKHATKYLNYISEMFGNVYYGESLQGAEDAIKLIDLIDRSDFVSDLVHIVEEMSDVEEITDKSPFMKDLKIISGMFTEFQGMNSGIDFTQLGIIKDFMMSITDVIDNISSNESIGKAKVSVTELISAICEALLMHVSDIDQTVDVMVSHVTAKLSSPVNTVKVMASGLKLGISYVNGLKAANKEGILAAAYLIDSITSAIVKQTSAKKKIAFKAGFDLGDTGGTTDGVREAAEKEAPGAAKQLVGNIVNETTKAAGDQKSNMLAIGQKLGAIFGAGVADTFTSGLNKLKNVASKLGAVIKGDLSMEDALKDFTGLNQIFGELGDDDGPLSAITKSITEATEGMDDFASSAGGAGGAAEKAKDKFTTLGEAIGKVINSRFSGMTFFEKLELKAETSADSILENMKSNLNGVKDWTDKLSQVAERGLDQGLIQVLAEAGIDSYDQISAFLSMSDEQLQEANALYAQQAQVREDVARRVGVAFKDSGANAVQGLLNGIYEASGQVGGAGEETARTFLTKFNDVLDIHSPSGVMRNNGMYIDQGLAQGVSFYKFIPIAECLSLARSIITALNSALSPSYFTKMGAYVCEGLAQGIEDNSDKPINKAKALAEAVAETMRSAFEINSPSHVTQRIGAGVVEGLVKGMHDNSKSAEKEATYLAKSTVSPLEEAIKSASTYVSENLDVNPTITPTLDLSTLMGQVDSISSLFADKEMAISAKGSKKSGSTFKSEDGTTSENGNINYNYIQNNYSPKALSRLDIYRDSRNLFSSMKGAAQGS